MTIIKIILQIPIESQRKLMKNSLSMGYQQLKAGRTHARYDQPVISLINRSSNYLALALYLTLVGMIWPPVIFANDNLESTNDATNIQPLRRYNLFPVVSFGTSTVINDDQLDASSYTGSLMGIAGGLNVTMEKFGFDLKLGWSSSKISVEAGEDLKKTSSTIPSEISTSFGEAEFAGRYRVANPFELGLSVLMPFGVDTSFAPEDTEDTTPSIFFGADLLFFHVGDKSSPMSNMRYGLQAFFDINISERDVFLFRLAIGYSFPVSETPGILYKEKIKTKEVIKYKTKYKDKVVTKFKSKYFIDAGIFYFVTGEHDLPSLTRQYLEALAKLLKTHDRDWMTINITSHTDKRGSDKLNKKLSANRAREVTHVFTQNNISLKRLKVYSKENKRPVESGDAPLSLARNRRVELTISGTRSMKALKSKILILLQRYKLPSTCKGSDCD